MNTEITNTSTEAKPVLAPVIFWNKFEDVKPNADEEYLVTNSDGIIRVSYYDGRTWGYYATVNENVLYWSILPNSPLL